MFPSFQNDQNALKPFKTTKIPLKTPKQLKLPPQNLWITKEALKPLEEEEKKKDQKCPWNFLKSCKFQGQIIDTSFVIYSYYIKLSYVLFCNAYDFVKHKIIICIAL